MIVPADSRYPRPSPLTSSVDIQHSEINDPELAWCGATKAAAGSESSPTSSDLAAIKPVPMRARRGVDPTTCTVALVRARRGCGEAGRVVHVVPLSGGTGTSGLLDALCGTSLVGDEVETVEPGVGVPCTGCLLYRDTMALPPSVSSYRAWGWPVRTSADQVFLDLGGRCTAVVLPAGLARAVTAILTSRDRHAPVLVNLGAPHERTLVAGEPYGVPLLWPGGARLVTGALALLPSTTPFEPLRWEQLPPDRSLAGRREIDIFGAVHTTLHAAAAAEGGCGK